MERATASPTGFREAIAYMNGVADAVSLRAGPIPVAPAPHRPPPAEASVPPAGSRRPTLRYGEVPERPFEAPAARRRTMPYGGADAREPPAAAGANAADANGIDPIWGGDGMERPSGVRLRCAPLQQEWYELAGARRQR